MADSCCDISHDSEKPSCPCGFLVRWLPYLLLIAGAILFARSQYAKFDGTASIIRYQASQPFAQVLVIYRLEGRNTAIGIPCAPDVATNLMQALAKAKPTYKKTMEGLEGAECEIRVMYRDGTRAAFKAARLEQDPLTLYVGTMLPENSSDVSPEEIPVLKLSMPAKVKNAGPIIGQIIDSLNAVGAQFTDEELMEKVRGATERKDAAPTEAAGEPATETTAD